MIKESKNFIKSKINLVIISRRICDTDKSEVRYVAKNTWGKEIRGCRIYNRHTPLSILVETISMDLQGIL